MYPLSSPSLLKTSFLFLIHRYLFWTEPRTKHIKRKNLVTSKIITLIKGKGKPQRLTLHCSFKSQPRGFNGNHSTGKTIFSSSYDGWNKTIFINGISNVDILDVSGDLLYYEKNNLINEMNVSSGHISRYIPLDKTKYYQLILVDSSIHTAGE